MRCNGPSSADRNLRHPSECLRLVNEGGDNVSEGGDNVSEGGDKVDKVEIR